VRPHNFLLGEDEDEGGGWTYNLFLIKNKFAKIV
jgi:hypothetical protein